MFMKSRLAPIREQTPTGKGFDMKIPQMEPLIEAEERQAVYDYMASGGWLTEHTYTKDFAKIIAEYTQSKYGYIMANGTVSLVAALYACGVRAGMEVIVPAFTMVATANAVELLGATVKFVDIEPQTLCMDFDKMVAAITPKTQAVIMVTLNGRHPSKIDWFVPYCHERGIWVIEDAAQALGSWYQGRALGTFGDIGSFSFSAPKIITTGQGGALITNNELLAENISKIRDFGREKPGADHYLTQGWNFKFTDLQAVIGIEQMKKLPQRIERKKQIMQLYFSLLRDTPGVSLFPAYHHGEVLWFMDIYIDDRDGLQAYLKNLGIGSRAVYPALPSEPVYGQNGEDFPIASTIARKGLWLPSSLTLKDEEISLICMAIYTYMVKGRIHGTGD